MTVYKRRVSSRDKRWVGRNITFITSKSTDRIPIEDTEVICNGCNGNIYSEEKETFGWLIYFSKRDAYDDRPYDVYCDKCTEQYFPKAVEVR